MLGEEGVPPLRSLAGYGNRYRDGQDGARKAGAPVSSSRRTRPKRCSASSKDRCDSIPTSRRHQRLPGTWASTTRCVGFLVAELGSDGPSHCWDGAVGPQHYTHHTTCSDMDISSTAGYAMVGTEHLAVSRPCGYRAVSIVDHQCRGFPHIILTFLLLQSTPGTQSPGN